MGEWAGLRQTGDSIGQLTDRAIRGGDGAPFPCLCLCEVGEV